MAEAPGTVGTLLGRCLAALGARRVFIAGPVTDVAPSTELGLDLHPVGDPELAALLAAADGRLGPGPGVALLDGRRVLLTSAPGVEPDVVEITDAGYLPGALAGWTLGLVHAAVVYDLDLDLAAPAPAGLEPVVLDDSSDDLLTLSPSLADFHTLVLVGPGVVRAGHVAGLRALADSLGCGVLNTWGAKGVFPWDDPHHFGTIGMQDRDVELSGLAEAELVITAGLDPLELPPERWMGSAQVLDVEPWQLSTLAHHWPDPGPVPEPPPLYRALSGALAGRYTSDDVPMAPARVVADLSAVLPSGGVVAADAGVAGLWVARAFPTLEPGSVVVPAVAVRGIAAATALAAALAGRPALAVTTSPVDAVTEAVIDLAHRLEQSIVLEVWAERDSLDRADEHRERVADAFDRPGVTRLDVPVRFADTELLIDAAGPVVAWTDPTDATGS